MSYTTILFNSSLSQNDSSATYSSGSATYYLDNYPYLWLGPGSTSRSTGKAYKSLLKLPVEELVNLANNGNTIKSLKIYLTSAGDISGQSQNGNFTAAVAVSNSSRYSRLWSDIRDNSLNYTNGIASERHSNTLYSIDITSLKDTLLSIDPTRDANLHICNTVENENGSSLPFAFMKSSHTSSYPYLEVEYGPSQIDVTKITLNSQNLDLLTNRTNGSNTNRIADTYQLTATVTPTNATNTSVYWWSENESVAKVSSSGLVTAVGNGTTDIFCRSVSNPSIEAKCSVRVRTDIQGINLSVYNLTLNIGQTYDVTGYILPTGTVYNPNVAQWLSLDSSIATVAKKNDTTGTITAVAAGSTQIEARSNYVLETGTTYWYNRVNVTVVNPSLVISETSKALICGNSFTLTATASGSDTVSWTTTNSNIATVSQGVVTTKNPGRCKIIATSSSGLTAECSILSVRINNTHFDKDEYKVFEGDNFEATLTVNIEPADATYTMEMLTSVGDSIEMGTLITNNHWSFKAPAYSMENHEGYIAARVIPDGLAAKDIPGNDIYYPSAPLIILMKNIVYYKTNGAFNPYILYYKDNGEFKQYILNLIK